MYASCFHVRFMYLFAQCKPAMLTDAFATNVVVGFVALGANMPFGHLAISSRKTRQRHKQISISVVTNNVAFATETGYALWLVVPHALEVVMVGMFLVNKVFKHFDLQDWSLECKWMCYMQFQQQREPHQHYSAILERRHFVSFCSIWFGVQCMVSYAILCLISSSSTCRFAYTSSNNMLAPKPSKV